jgi:hypothetical protein
MLRLFTASALLLAACASEDPRPASFTAVYSTVIRPRCTTVACHNRLSQTYGLRLDTRTGAYVMLTGRACSEPPVPGQPGGNFVIPGQPDRSKLMHLLYGENVPRRMPPDSPLAGPDIELVERWILEGALCD